MSEDHGAGSGPHPRPGPVRLRVRDPRGTGAFYREALGLEHGGTLGEWERFAAPGGGRVLVELARASSDRRPGPGAPPGLFHMAFMVPGRPSLARALSHLRRENVPFQGFSDHLVSEAIYLADPEGNGIEIYRDRPREGWPRDDRGIRMATLPLDTAGLLSEAGDAPAAGAGALPEGTVMGHVHLRASELTRAEAFLSGVLGMDVVTRAYPGALFFSYGGYHHHVGANVWDRRGAAEAPPPPGAPGLDGWSLIFPGDGGARAAADAARDSGLTVEEREGQLILTDHEGIRVRLLRP